MGGNEVLAGIEKEKLIVIFRGVPTEDAADVARALADGGVKFIEITYNHCKDDPEAYFEEQMMAVKAAVGDRVCMGAGTGLPSGSWLHRIAKLKRCGYQAHKGIRYGIHTWCHDSHRDCSRQGLRSRYSEAVYSRRYKPCEVPYGTIGAYPHAGYLQCKS